MLPFDGRRGKVTSCQRDCSTLARRRMAVLGGQEVGDFDPARGGGFCPANGGIVASVNLRFDPAVLFVSQSDGLAHGSHNAISEVNINNHSIDALSFKAKHIASANCEQLDGNSESRFETVSGDVCIPR